MDKLVEKMNDVLNSWKEKYDLSYGISLRFSIDHENLLYFNEKSLVLINDLELDSVQFDAESIIFYFSDNRRIYINMLWPEEEAPRVKAVFFGHIF